MEILRFAFTYAVAAKLAPIKKTKSMTWKFAKYLGEEIESFLPHFEGTCEKTFNDVTHLSARRPLDGAGPLAEHGVGDDDGRGDLSDERERGLAESLAVADSQVAVDPLQPSPAYWYRGPWYGLSSVNRSVDWTGSGLPNDTKQLTPRVYSRVVTKNATDSNNQSKNDSEYGDYKTMMK